MFVKYGIDQKRLIQQLEEKEDELLRTAFLEPTISNIQAIIILCCHPTQVTYPLIWLRAGIAIRMVNLNKQPSRQQYLSNHSFFFFLHCIESGPWPSSVTHQYLKL
jgi:hypothetical protein